ncbi:MAG: zf-TFIIB domain-containing protein [Gemmatimonadales bacterium]
MSIEKPSKGEDEYFARQDAELLQHERTSLAADAAAAERKSHEGKCPRCGYDLTTEDYHGVQVDRCHHCGGIWLDAGELDQVARHHDPGLLTRVFVDLSKALRGQQRHG